MTPVLVTAITDASQGFEPISFDGAIAAAYDGGWPWGSNRRWNAGGKIDKAALSECLARIPAGSRYLLNINENDFGDASLSEVASVLRPAQARGLITAWYGYTTREPALNERVYRKLGPVLSLLLASYYHGSTKPLTDDEENSLTAYLSETDRQREGRSESTGLIVCPFVNTDAGESSTPLPIAILLRIVDIAIACRMSELWVYTTQGRHPHTRDAVAAIRDRLYLRGVLR